jgi:DDE superfamily endonuclease/Archaeal putative transposase ISC1217
MGSIPPAALPLLLHLAPAFTQPTFRRSVVLLFAAILTTGRRTVHNLLRTVGILAPGDASSYRRVLSEASWSGLRLAAALTRFVVSQVAPAGILHLVGDDTVDEHRGKNVHGKARHRDPIRSSHTYTTYRYGHKWVVVALLIHFPWARRPWALPLLVVLYRSQTDNAQRGRPHQTPTDLVQWQLRLLLRWLPDRAFVFAGDSGYGSHALAHFAQQQGGRLTLVSRFYADANLYEPPPPYGGKGRPRVKGARLPTPAQVVATAARTPLEVGWYGGGRRQVEVVTGVGHWYQSGAGLVPLRWVWVHDVTGTHRDDYLYSTDMTWTAQQIIETYTGRWNIETTFQEMRAYLGLESTRGWCQRTVLRAAPCLFGVYTVVAVLFAGLRAAGTATAGVAWAKKEGTTFSDAITTVRRWLWTDWVFAGQGHDQAFAKIPEALRDVLLSALAPAA